MKKPPNSFLPVELPYLANRAHWARTYMSKAGLLISPKRNVHQVTDLGRRFLAEGLQRIDNTVLARFDGFGDWRTSSDQV